MSWPRRIALVAAGTATEAVQRYLDWNQGSGAGLRLRGACGGLLVLLGVYLVCSGA